MGQSQRFSLRIIVLFSAATFILAATTPAGAQLYRYEAELGALNGTLVSTAVEGYSGTGYVTDFTDDGDSLSVGIDVPGGLYDLYIGYRSEFGEKGYDLRVGGTGGSGMFEGTTTFAEEFGGQYFLDGGATDLEILRGWGYYDVDYFELRSTAPRQPLPVAPTLVNPNASPAAQQVMNYLAANYGSQTLYGQQREHFNSDYLLSDNYLQHSGGIMPSVLGTDLMNYSPSRRARGANPNNETERMIQWAQETGGIPSVMWHWNAPTDLIDGPNGSGQEWYSGFYTRATTFDLGAALADRGGANFQLLIDDIDTMAGELQKYEDAGVPVLWRPLHEAQGNRTDNNPDGAWFWWGNSGPEALKELWGVMYERLVDHHGIDNLIWAFTAQVDTEGWQEWYPGDDQVDIVGTDIYGQPGDNMSRQWLQLLDEYDGEKLLALTESGTLPPEDALERYGVAWSYMMPWNESFFTSSSSPEEAQRILGDDDVIDLTEIPFAPWRPVPEPAGALLAVTALGGLLVRRRGERH